ncbi:MAG: 4Fe-4S ferredoxin, partial [Deltaproteobacteria bacterium]|nr:4Fe-4S ferredoxin [Deltaproteobacteria bacterium]
MPSQIYQDLREQLDQYSVGFPETESGVEYQLLERLFDEDEARTFLEMSIMAEPADSLAARTGQDVEPLTQRLEGMVDKGLIFRLEKGGVVKYGASAFMVGSYE